MLSRTERRNVMYTPDINAFDADVQRQYRDYYKDFTDKYGFTPTEYSSLLFWQLEEYYSGINGLTSAPIWKSVEKSYFLVEKKKYDEETARLEQRLHELQSKQELQQENEQQIEKNISQLGCYAEQMELSEEIKEKLIDKENVYSDNRIEICWNFDSGFFDLEIMHKCG